MQRPLLILVALASLLAAPHASADFRSTDPGDWQRNRCVSRNVMSASVAAAPIGLILLTSDDRGGRRAGYALSGAALAGLATGMALRIRMPNEPGGLNDPRAAWLGNRCQFRSFASWGVPIFGVGALMMFSARTMGRTPLGRTVGRYVAIAGAVLMAGGLSMTLYGAIKARQQGERPGLATPLVEVPAGSVSLSIGLTSLGVGGSF